MKDLKPKEQELIKKLKTHLELGHISKKYHDIFLEFFLSFKRALHGDSQSCVDAFLIFIELFVENFQRPYQFSLYHQKIRAPFDYYEFGNNFFKPLIDKQNSKVLGKEHLIQVEKQIKAGENVVFFANHQIESDPQALSLLLEETCPFLADKVISVAGERVTTDPLAIPFSMGCDLLCIYSKKYIDTPAEHKHYKQAHNKKTMQVMQELFKEGGKLIYVAPSGGRDRKNKEGIVKPALFDSRSIEMFYLIAKKAKTPTHFYPLALSTYDLLPPPETTEKELGEARSTNKTPISLALGSEIDMNAFDTCKDKQEKREKRALSIYQAVLEGYEKIAP